MEPIRLHLALPIMLGGQLRVLSGPQRSAYEMQLAFELEAQWQMRGAAEPLQWTRIEVVRAGSRVPSRSDLAAGAERVRDVLLPRDIGRPFGRGIVLSVGAVTARYHMVPASRIGTVILLDPHPWPRA